MDDLTTGSDDVEGAYEFYMKAKLRLAEAGFNLRKFVTNSLELRRRIRSDEGMSSSDCAEHQVLRVKWDVISDQLILDISEICHVMKDMKPTKRNAVSLATRFFDPLGVISLITMRFKLLFQQLCEAIINWDEPLSGRLLEEWKALTSVLQQCMPMMIPRCCIGIDDKSVVSCSLLGFCDAFKDAYAAVVYLKVDTKQIVPITSSAQRQE